jgi:pyruvate formate lyase activating enzyme
MPVNKIIPFSCVDGPGNRMAIFFQGCNFHCSYCHNPETIHLCSQCGACVPACPAGALTLREGRVVWEESRCLQCDACIHACPSLSSPKTKDLSVAELMAVIRRAAPFLEGITVSGGECTLNAPFLTELFRAVRRETRLTCFVDTNGGIDLAALPELVALTDGFMLDVKSALPEEHRTLTGCGNETVLRNLDFLLRQNKLYEVRTVIAPGLDHEATVRRVAERIGDRCIYKIITYRRFGVRPAGLAVHGTASPSRDIIDALVALARASGAARAVAV